MQIVTDRGCDLSPQQLEGLDLHYLPLRITLDGVSYLGGEDLSSEAFYQLLSETESFPTTSQPSAGEFAELYRSLAEKDPDILSIHISSGLSGTINAAKAGRAMVPDVNVTIVDSKTLSCPLGWQVEAAARALKAGWSMDRIFGLLHEIHLNTEGYYTLNSLKYLIHGGRISHIKGLVASLLNIKPIIGVEKENGTYTPYGQEITLKRAIQKLVDIVGDRYPEGTLLRVQPLHGNNPEAVQTLIEKMTQRFDCKFEATTPIAPSLGAHTGPSMVGLAVAPLGIFSELM